MTRPALKASHAQAPLVIGVTGHRDLREPDIEPLERKVAHIFQRLREQYPFTPFLLLSALAEGADRLVARVALSPEIQARLVAPLPMPVELYEEDFRAPGSLREFRHLLSKAAGWFEVPSGADVASIRVPGPARDRCYEAAGLYIARQSQILIALWDGEETGKVGGTAAVVKFQTEGPPSANECDFQPPELFPAYHVLTPRLSNPAPAGEPCRLREIYPPVFHRDESAKYYYTRLFRNLDEFNRLLAEGGDQLDHETAESKRELLGEFKESVLSDREALALDRYAYVDALATRYGRQMVQAHRVLHRLVLWSFFCFVLFAHLPKAREPWLFASLAFLAIAYVSHQRARRINVDTRSQDYRAVAEGCRVRFFWKIAGVQESVPDNYLVTQRTELDWIRNGLRGWDIAAGEESPGTFSDVAKRLEFVLKRWVDAQSHYFKSKARENLDTSELNERGVKRLIYVTLILAGAIAILSIVNARFHYEWYEFAVTWSVIVIDSFLAAGALLHHLSERLAYAEHAKQYKRMEGVFGSASKAIREKIAANDLHAARACLQALGKEALAENGEWVLLHRERPLELPHP